MDAAAAKRRLAGFRITNRRPDRQRVDYHTDRMEACARFGSSQGGQPVTATKTGRLS